MRSKIALSTCVVKPAGEATLISIQRPVTVGRVGVRTGLGVGAGVPNALKTDPMLPLTALPTLLLTGEGSTIGAPVILSSPTRKSGVNVSAPIVLPSPVSSSVGKAVSGSIGSVLSALGTPAPTPSPVRTPTLPTVTGLWMEISVASPAGLTTHVE